MSNVELAVLVLAAWRITAFLAYERWLESARTRVGVDMVDEDGVPVTFLGKVFGCFWCLSIPAAVICLLLALVNAWWILTPLACSGGVVLVNHVSRVFLYAED